MSSDHVTIRTREDRVIVAINGSGPGLTAELTAAFELARQDPTWRLVVVELTGAGLDDEVCRFVSELVSHVEHRIGQSLVIRRTGNVGLHLHAEAQVEDGSTDWLFPSWVERCETANLLPLVYPHARALTRHIADVLRRAPARDVAPFPLLVELERDTSPAVEISAAMQQLAILRRILSRSPGATDQSVRDLGDDLIDRCAEATVLHAVTNLEALSLVDSLTGLLNRRALGRDLPTAIAAAQRGHHELSIAMIDIDGLKAINDADGHTAGDDTLRSFGRSWTERMRAGDDLFRVGGDEFVLMLPGAGREEASTILTRGLASSGQPYSWGLATFPADGDDGATLLDIADRRLLSGRAFRDHDPDTMSGMAVGSR